MYSLSSWPLGWLPVAIVLVGWIAMQLAGRIVGEAPRHVRWVAASVWGTAYVVLSTWILALVGSFTRPALLSTWAITALLLSWPWRPVPLARFPWRLPASAWLPLGVALVGLIIASVTAYWLPVWHWDSLAYHLPYVNFILQDEGLAGVPPDVPYLSTYPHAAELCFAALRLLLPDDRLIDLGQIPFGLLGGIGVASFSRSMGARAVDAVVAGALWWTLPAVFLQLPTNYVDVAAAAALLLACAALASPMRLGVVLTAGAAIGLFLGTKPSAPLGALVLCAVLAFRVGPRRPTWVAAAAAFVLLLGAESYVNNLVRHGNPIWPVIVDVGPLHLPGIETLDKLLSSGAGTYRISGPMPLRMLRSWTSLTAPPMFDMRVGGFGPLFLLALPLGIACLLRRKVWFVVALLVASVAAPDPALARYVLGFPGLVLGLAAAWPPFVAASVRAQTAVHGLVAAGALWNLVYAYPALSGEGPPLLSYAGMSQEARMGAVGGEGPPTALLAARAQLAPGEGAAFDHVMDFAYLLWTPKLDHRVVRVPDAASPAEVAALLARENVRLIGAGPGTPLGDFIQRERSRYNLIHVCDSADCEIYWRR